MKAVVLLASFVYLVFGEQLIVDNYSYDSHFHDTYVSTQYEATNDIEILGGYVDVLVNISGSFYSSNGQLHISTSGKGWVEFQYDGNDEPEQLNLTNLDVDLTSVGSFLAFETAVEYISISEVRLVWTVYTPQHNTSYIYTKTLNSFISKNRFLAPFSLFTPTLNISEFQHVSAISIHAELDRSLISWKTLHVGSFVTAAHSCTDGSHYVGERLNWTIVVSIDESGNENCFNNWTYTFQPPSNQEYVLGSVSYDEGGSLDSETNSQLVVKLKQLCTLAGPRTTTITFSTIITSCTTPGESLSPAISQISDPVSGATLDINATEPCTCDLVRGACCHNDATCTENVPFSYCTGTWYEGETCSATYCGACCVASNASCTQAPTKDICETGLSGIYRYGTPCADNCGACCIKSDSCQNGMTRAICDVAGGIYHDGTLCKDYCGACCDSLTCGEQTTKDECDGIYLDGTPCADNCGACCFTNNSTVQSTNASCVEDVNRTHCETSLSGSYTHLEACQNICTEPSGTTTGAPTESESSNNNTALIIGISIVAAVAFLAIIIVFVVMIVRSFKSKNVQQEQAGNGTLELEESCITTNVVIEYPIGRGNFGQVYKGIWQGITEVALKQLTTSESEALLNEIKLLKEFNHPNIVRYFGVYKSPKNMFVMMEYMAQGDVSTLLQNNKQTYQVIDLLSICMQAAAGMTYLEEKKVIHRDLAARNLLATHGDIHHKATIKIADFGLSRITEAGFYKSETKTIPFKWTAPEVILHGTYSSGSDVWSFGITMWEIFSYGELPYHSMTNKETTDAVVQGYRLSSPSKCPQSIYQVMQFCWKENANDRPSFEENWKSTATLISVEQFSEIDGSEIDKFNDKQFYNNS